MYILMDIMVLTDKIAFLDTTLMYTLVYENIYVDMYIVIYVDTYFNVHNIHMYIWMHTRMDRYNA